MFKKATPLILGGNLISPMWRYGENLVHYHLSPHHIMVGWLCAILAWMLFHLFLSRGKRRGRRQLPSSLEATQSLFKLPILFFVITFSSYLPSNKKC
jgi:small-conductance mechanosensitive channel